MFKQIVIVLSAVIITILTHQSLPGQEAVSEENYPTDVTKWRFVLNGSSKVVHPTNVVRADNNWEILLACMTGKTREDLEQAGIRHSESQLMLLRSMQLLEQEDKTLKTVMPIIGGDQMRTIRAAMKELAVNLAPDLQEDIDTLANELKRIGRESSMFTLLFSMSLDNVPFYYAKKKGIIKEEQLSTEKHLWGGQFHAFYPPRDLRCGTNSSGEKGVWICLNWAEGPWEKISKYFYWENMSALYNEYVKNGKVTSEDLKSRLAETGIFDADGNLTLPIISKKGNSLLHDTCETISEKAGNLFVNHIDLDGVMQKCGLQDKAIAMSVFYHEWEWEYMALLEERGIVKRPFAFTNPEEAGPKDIGALVFIVDRREDQ